METCFFPFSLVGYFQVLILFAEKCSSLIVVCYCALNLFDLESVKSRLVHVCKLYCLYSNESNFWSFLLISVLCLLCKCLNDVIWLTSG